MSRSTSASHRRLNPMTAPAPLGWAYQQHWPQEPASPEDAYDRTLVSGIHDGLLLPTESVAIVVGVSESDEPVSIEDDCFTILGYGKMQSRLSSMAIWSISRSLPTTIQTTSDLSPSRHPERSA